MDISGRCQGQEGLMNGSVAQGGIGPPQLLRAGNHSPEAQEIQAIGGNLPPQVNAPGDHRLAPGVNDHLHFGEMGDEAVAVEVQVPDLSLPALGGVKHAAAGDFATHAWAPGRPQSSTTLALMMVMYSWGTFRWSSTGPVGIQVILSTTSMPSVTRPNTA